MVCHQRSILRAIARSNVTYSKVRRIAHSRRFTGHSDIETLQLLADNLLKTSRLIEVGEEFFR